MTSPDPLFSVVIPTRGDSDFLRAALRSALEQHVSLEVLLAHDRRRGEPSLFREPPGDPRVRVVESDLPGPAAARNAGVARARGRYAAFLDDDDLWLPGHLARRAGSLARNPGAVLAAGDAYVDDRRDPRIDRRNGGHRLPRFDPRFRGDRITLRELLLANPILTPTVVLDLEAAGEETHFRTDLPVMEDYELWLRLEQKGALLWDPEPTVIVRRLQGSASSDWRKMAEGSIRILNEQLRAGIPSGALSRREISRRLGGLWHDLAYACLAEGDRAGTRRAVRRAVARTPWRAKTYLYAAVSFLPDGVRRRVLSLRMRYRRGSGRAEPVRTAGHGEATVPPDRREVP